MSQRWMHNIADVVGCYEVTIAHRSKRPTGKQESHTCSWAGTPQKARVFARPARNLHEVSLDTGFNRDCGDFSAAVEYNRLVAQRSELDLIELS